MWHIFCSKCHSMMYISTVLGHLISAFCALSVLMMVESYFRCAVRNVLPRWNLPLIFGCVIFGLGDVRICNQLLPLHLKLLFGYLLLGVMDLVSIWVDGCQWWSQFITSFKMSQNCLTNVCINLSHSKYKGSICTMYLLLTYHVSLLTSLIRSPCTLLIWIRST